MATTKRLLKIGILLLIGVFLAAAIASEAWARAGRGLSGGGSFGSRGSRSFTPVRPYTPPSVAPSPTIKPPVPGPVTPPLATQPRAVTPPPTPQPQPPSFWRSFGAGLLGGLAGGMLAHWLFGGTPAAAATPGSGGPGFGLLDIILLAGVGYLIYWLVVKRRREEEPAYQGAYQSTMTEATLQPPSYEVPSLPEGRPDWDLEEGLRHIRQMDPLFSEDRFKDQAMDYFFKIQGAWADRDLNSVRHLLTEEMFRLLQEDADKMRREGLINRLENIGVREVNITEAWQEAGQDYITVRIYANLIDYTINEKTGEIVEGSRTEPVKFEEYWTFVRPVGNNPWKLSAINQAEQG